MRLLVFFSFSVWSHLHCDAKIVHRESRREKEMEFKWTNFEQIKRNIFAEFSQCLHFWAKITTDCECGCGEEKPSRRFGINEEEYPLRIPIDNKLLFDWTAKNWIFPDSHTERLQNYIALISIFLAIRFVEVWICFQRLSDMQKSLWNIELNIELCTSFTGLSSLCVDWLQSVVICRSDFNRTELFGFISITRHQYTLYI